MKTKITIFILIVLLLTSCTIKLQPDPGVSGVLAFVPPTAEALQPTPIPTINATLLAPPTPEIICQDNLLFLNDLSIPDGTEIEAGASLDKRWEVQNNGTCNWETGYTIRLIGGDDLGSKTIQDLIPARSGAIVTIRIPFLAPTTPGNYRSAWQAYNPNDIPFGDPFYIDIVVKE
ncbi:MAG: hypothetical protein CL609_06440 [Anaerolineaceae bacterium]|nr:hypothetical protein [Anaerolineaceae bacterium]